MPQTGDSSDTGQYESISSSTPNIVYAHINPAQECEMEYEEVRWKNDHALPCGSTQYTDIAADAVAPPSTEYIAN